MKVSLIFGKPGYIAQPYWPEMYRLIEIQKRSGVNRARSEESRRKALESMLKSEGMSLEDYEELSRLALRPFHVNGSGRIYIPRDRVLACLVNASDQAPSRLRLRNIRSALAVSDFETDKSEPDGTWERFVVVKSGTGKNLSNQRGYRSSAYIEDFTAKGRMDVHEAVKPQAVLELLRFAGTDVGIGASRKMGWGRFGVEWSE